MDRFLYIDTSVIGGFFDTEFSETTRKLWKLKEEGVFKFVASVVTKQEIEPAPEAVRELFAKTFKASELIRPTREAVELAREYMKRGILPQKYFEDALHVAICTTGKINYLASWNYKHLTKQERESAFNDVNLLLGYPAIHIVNPNKLIEHHEKGI